MNQTIAKLRPSARKLHGMLPKTFTVRIEVVGDTVTAVSVLDGQGKDSGLDPHYPGFAQGLASLVAAGLVLHWGDVPKGTQAAGRLDRVFSTVRVDAKKGVDGSAI